MRLVIDFHTRHIYESVITVPSQTQQHFQNLNTQMCMSEHNPKSEVLTVANIKIRPTVFWAITPCSLVRKYQCFEERAASIFTVDWAQRQYREKNTGTGAVREPMGTNGPEKGSFLNAFQSSLRINIISRNSPSSMFVDLLLPLVCALLIHRSRSILSV
jgi:hypothetical protein